MFVTTPERCVLLLSDEAINVYDIERKQAHFVQAIYWNAKHFEALLIDAIVQHCKNKPVLVLVDMVEQHYRKERIPNVSPLDRPNVIKRKLRSGFPKFTMRAAKKLRDESRKQAKKNGDVYLFAALPSSKSFSRTIDAVVKSNAPIAGIGLLPVESASLVASLQNKLGKNDSAVGKATWSILITQNQSGGLRQIVTKNGELALTRVTPITETDSDPGEWANEVAQEFKATMSYLTRFGYSPDDGLNVMVVANQKAGNLVEQFISEDCSFTAMTVTQAASDIGLKIGNQEDGRVADPLHAAWTGRKLRLSMPMYSQRLQKAYRLHQGAAAAMLVFFISMVFLVYSNANAALTFYKKQQDYQVWKKQKEQLDVIYKNEIERKRALGFDVKLIGSSLEIHNAFKQDEIKPLPLLKEIDNQLGSNLRIDSFTINAKKRQQSRDQKNPTYKRDVTATMTISFPGTIDIEKGNTVVEDLRKRLDAVLAQYEVRVAKKLADLSFRGEFSAETGLTADRRRPDQPYEAQIEFNRVNESKDNVRNTR